MSRQHPEFGSPSSATSRNAAVPHRALLDSFEALFDSETLTKAVLLEALERKSDGVMLLGLQGEVAFLNATAEAILRQADGLTYVDGRFVTARLPETRRLQDCIRDATAAASNDRQAARVLVTRPSGKAPYVICVLPAPGRSTAQGGRCVIHIVDLATQALLSKDAACATFGLSDREGDLAVELTRSNNLKSAAARAGMAVNTARNHMHSIFAKCQVHSQVELSRILAKLI